MYAHFYRLAENPFNLTPDPKFHYINESTREAMASIVHGIGARKGFLTLVGEAGTGKTTLLKRIVEEVEGETIVVFVFNPGVTFDELLEFICMELGIAGDARRRLTLLDRLNEFLLEQLTEGRNVVVMIDEAQTIEDSVLEELRLLSNLETSKEKILQILLAGQPELEDKLRRPGLRQLRQRIAVRATLKPMRADEIGAYVSTRLRSAGASSGDLFAPAALRKIWTAAQGIPRVINVICDNAMMIAFAEGKQRISASVTAEAVRDLFGAEAAPRLLDRVRQWLEQPALRYSAAAVPLALVGSLAVSMVRDANQSGAAPAQTAAPVSPSNEIDDRAAVQRGAATAAKTPLPASTGAITAGGPRAEERETAAPPPGNGSAATRTAQAIGAGTQLSASVSDRGKTETVEAESSPGVADPSVVDNTVRMAEVVARSTAARLYYSKRVSLEDSAKQVLDDGIDRPGKIASSTPASAMPNAAESVEDASGVDVNDAGASSPAGREDSAAFEAEKPQQIAAAAQPAAVSATDAQPEYSADGVVLSGLGPAAGEPVIGQYVRVLPGDTVWDIAVAHYGSAGPVTLERILNSNPRMTNPRQLEVGSLIYLPFERPEQMVGEREDGTYRVLVATAPGEAELLAVKAWLEGMAIDGKLVAERPSGSQRLFRLEIRALESRDEAIRAASLVLAAYSRERGPRGTA
jgi:general secretion pathway protein A